MENFTHKKFTLNESNTIKRIMSHKLGGLLTEQQKNEDRYEGAGYKKVKKLNLPDGAYIGNPDIPAEQKKWKAENVRYVSDLHLYTTEGSERTGYMLQVSSPSRSGYEDVPVEIKNGIANSMVTVFASPYYKDIGYKPADNPSGGDGEKIKTITNKIKSEGIKNVSNEMITSPQFKGDYSGYVFGGEFKGINYQWDASGVEGMSGVRGFVKGEVITEKNTVLQSDYNIEDADPSGVWVGFYDGKTAFVCYMTNSGGAKCKNIM